MITGRANKHYKTVSAEILLESTHDGAGNKHWKKPVYDIDTLIQEHPAPERWVEHIEKELLPYWMSDAATTFVHNLFPTFRTNKGELLPENKTDWPEEFLELAKDKDLEKELLDGAKNNYVRAHSRQTFAYGIAYNVTGNEECLKLCRKGAQALMSAFDGNNGMYTKQNAKTGEWGDIFTERTSQDLAYGISGIAMYYYLTHDEKALAKILQAKKFIFDNYFDEGKGIFTWHPKQKGEPRVEIVAQLDQIYGYMMFLTPSLPEPYQTEWKKELKDIANILINRFYSQRFGFFWGAGTTHTGQDFGTDHTDFGHSVKTMWLIYQIGMLTNETSFVIFAREKINSILKNAFIKETETQPASWAKRFIKNKTEDERELDKDKEWWGLAELDQACAILAINDPSYLSYLNKTYDYWFKNMIDTEFGEIWHYVAAAGNKPVIKFPKIHTWKNAFHSFEHALFGYLISSEIKNKNFNLYYAFASRDEVNFKTVSPYLFKANIVNSTEYDMESYTEGNRKKIRVTFNMLR